MIKAIVFDFDGLIIDTETVWYHAFREVLLNYQIKLPLEDFAPFIGTHGTVFDEYLEKQLGQPNLLPEIKRMVSQLHRENIQHVDARPGVREYLEEAKSLGLRIALASSSDREWVEGYLKKLKLLPYFEVIKTEDDVKQVKPDPELYVKAIEALGIQPHEVLAFEDSANGAKAAKAAGVNCVICPNPVTRILAFENYDLRIESMADQSLARVVQQIEAKMSAV